VLRVGPKLLLVIAGAFELLPELLRDLAALFRLPPE
jgi:hypothetical protein